MTEQEKIGRAIKETLRKNPGMSASAAADFVQTHGLQFRLSFSDIVSANGSGK